MLMQLEYVPINQTRFVADCVRVRMVKITGFVFIHPMDHVPRHTVEPIDSSDDLIWNQYKFDQLYSTRDDAQDAHDRNVKAMAR